jgi:murein DD-endopeptidase MepM/ murein hydrolase activator NlpD
MFLVNGKNKFSSFNICNLISLCLQRLISTFRWLNGYHETLNYLNFYIFSKTYTFKMAKVLSIFLLFLSGCTLFEWTIKDEKEGVWHTVNKGETLWRIARTYKVDIELIAKENGIEDPTQISIGQKIFIPGAKRVLKVEPFVAEKRLEFIWSLKGRVTSYFGRRESGFHKGIDIAANEGTKIQASCEGIVTYSGFYRNYGNVVIITHQYDFSTVYAHNKENLVKVEDRVKQGDVIALLGSTGRSTGPHLHFEIRFKGRAKDPLGYLE